MFVNINFRLLGILKFAGGHLICLTAWAIDGMFM